jgi:T5orf172 domain
MVVLGQSRGAAGITVRTMLAKSEDGTAGYRSLRRTVVMRPSPTENRRRRTSNTSMMMMMEPQIQQPHPQQHPRRMVTCEGGLRWIDKLVESRRRAHGGEAAKSFQRLKQTAAECKEVLTRYIDGDRGRVSMVVVEEGALRRRRRRGNIHMEPLSTSGKSVLFPAPNQTQQQTPTCYVYATHSAAFPGLVKIGKTDNVPRRLSQLNVSCAPMPHRLIAAAPTLNHHRDEKLAHAHFARFRRQGEFFALEPQAVRAWFARHIAANYYREIILS